MSAVKDMGISVEISSKSCAICEGRVFSGGSASSDISRCLECRSVLSELTSSNKSFHCTSSGRCTLTRLTRYHCLYCFVKKSLSSGCATGCVWHQGLNNSGSFAPTQNPDGEPVQIIDVEIDFAGQFLSSEEVGPTPSDLDNSAFDVCNTLCRVAFSHLKFCPTTAEKLKGFVPLQPSPSMVAMEDKEEEEEALVPTSSADARCCAVFCKLAGNMNSTIVSIVEFLRRLPGYDRVAKEEQMNLLKECFFKVWLLWSVPGFIGPPNRRLILNENLSLAFSELSDVYGVEFVLGLFDFARNWTSLGLRDAEIGLCAGIVLSTMSQATGTLFDCTGHIIQETKELLKTALRQLLTQNNPTAPNLTENVLHLISNLDSISCSHSKLLHKFHNQWRRLGIAPLFAEVFNFPHTEETEIVSLVELDNEDVLCVEEETLVNEVDKKVVRSPSDFSNQVEDIESCSELGNLGDVSSSDLMSNIDESEGELGNYGVPSQSDLCAVEEIFQSELNMDGEIYKNLVDEDVLSRELNEYDIFPRGLLSLDEDSFQNKLSKDIFQGELSNDEIIFRNEVGEADVQIDLSDDGDIFPSESRDGETNIL